MRPALLSLLVVASLIVNSLGAVVEVNVESRDSLTTNACRSGLGGECDNTGDCCKGECRRVWSQHVWIKICAVSYH